MSELWQLIDASGNTLDFHDDLQFINRNGFGTPPIAYQSAKGYRQHGASVTNYALEPRPFEFVLYKGRTTSRTQYWENRKALLAFFNVIRAPFTLRVTREDGSRRELSQIYPTIGLPLIDERENANDNSIQDVVSLTAFDPVWRNPTQVQLTNLTATVPDELVFPITFPIEFGSAGIIFETGELNYNGSWLAYPVITLTGPWTSATLTLTKGTITVAIQFYITVAANDTRVLTLDPANLSVVTGSGVNAIGELTDTSNLADFVIEPYQSTQSITAKLLGGDDTYNDMDVEYYERYIGI